MEQHWVSGSGTGSALVFLLGSARDRAKLRTVQVVAQHGAEVLEAPVGAAAGYDAGPRVQRREVGLESGVPS